jgi:SAM-dependent methyltransferase
MKETPDDWTVGFFDDPYTELFPFPDAAQTEYEVDALARLLPPPPARVLDVACGQGRHAIRLARRGYEMVGVDTSASFLATARASAAEFAADVDFVESDMRNLDFVHEFDAALSLCTAWGYFDDDTNQQVLDRIARSLRSDGRLVIDLIHRDWLTRVSEPKAWVELGDGSFAVAERTFDCVTGINTVTHRWRTPSGELRERQHRLRIYCATELDRMLRQAGLVPVNWYGGFSLKPFGTDTRRMLVVANRNSVGANGRT